VKRTVILQDYITRSFMICTPHQILFRRWNKEERTRRGM